MRRLLLVCVLGLVASSCSGDPSPVAVAGDDGSATSTEPSVATTAPPSTEPPETSSTLPGEASTTSDAPVATVTTTTVPLVPLEELSLVLTEVAQGFEQPVLAAAAPGDSRLFVVDQPGRIWTIDGPDVEVFLDIRDRVVFGGERGLLGVAFPADYATSGVFYVNYIGRGNNGDETRVASFARTGAVADAASEQIVLRIDQPASNHNGGMIAFGPDGYLWIGTGDGGGRDDRFGHGQRTDSLLGAMLRIDVRPDGYAIPPDNPSATDESYAPEVWATGLRNPWRFTFDGTDVWIGDVGQDAVEEVDQMDASMAGINYGWPLFEGTACYLSNCSDAGLTPPVTEYRHSDGCSITGGVVYRGEAIPELDGQYLFGDFCGGWVQSFGASGEVLEWFGPGSIAGLAGFGTDVAGEVHVVSTSGSVFRIDRG